MDLMTGRAPEPTPAAPRLFHISVRAGSSLGVGGACTAEVKEHEGQSYYYVWMLKVIGPGGLDVIGTVEAALAWLPDGSRAIVLVEPGRQGETLLEALKAKFSDVTLVACEITLGGKPAVDDHSLKVPFDQLLGRVGALSEQGRLSAGPGVDFGMLLAESAVGLACWADPRRHFFAGGRLEVLRWQTSY